MTVAQAFALQGTVLFFTAFGCLMTFFLYGQTSDSKLVVRVLLSVSVVLIVATVASFIAAAWAGVV